MCLNAHWRAGIAAALFLVGSAPAWAAGPGPSGDEKGHGRGNAIEVMVLGTWHFAAPGLDLHNIKADDVLQRGRQRELADIAERLASFRPTKIMVEKVAKQPGLEDEEYSAFTVADLASSRNERIQIGYRLAHRTKLPSVFAIDEQPGTAEPDYFPFDRVKAWAEAHGKGAELDAVMRNAGAFTGDFERRQSQQTLVESLIEFNDPGGFNGRMDIYYGMLPFGDEENQPGAELNSMWYLRNAKIFAKLMKLAKPGDRVLVVYGAGHAYWLRHFADQTPGYRNVDPIPYLRSSPEP